jgi:tetratricopeptide (TPR) repeat protein
MTRVLLVALWACLSQICVGQQIVVSVEPIENYSSYEDHDLRIGESLAEAIKLRLLFEEDIRVSAEEDVDFTIYGYYEILQGEILIELAIDNNNQYESIFLDPVSVHRSNIYSAVDGLVNEVLENLHENAQIVNYKTVAILCYSAAPGSEIPEEILLDLEFVSFFELPASLSPIHYGGEGEYCDAPNLNDVAMQLEYQGIDAVLRAEVSAHEGDLYISPILHVPTPDGGQSITPVAFVSPDYETEFDAESFGQYLRSAFGGAVLANGDWGFEQYTTSTSSDVEDIFDVLRLEFEKDEPDVYTAYVLTQQALELAPERGESYHYLGMYHLFAFEYEYATEAFTIATTLDPLNKDSHLMLGMLYEWSEEYGLAAEVYENAYSSLSDPEFLLPLGRAYFFIDDLEKCITWMVQAEEVHQDNEDVIRDVQSYLGASYSSLGHESYREAQYQKAIEYCSAASKYVYDDFDEFQVIMKSHNRLGNYTTSLELVDERVKAKLLPADFLIQFAQDLRSLKEEDGSFMIPALEQSITALELYITRVTEEGKAPIARCYQRLGSTYFRLKRLDEAIESYKIALDLDRDYLGHYLNLAEAAIMNDQFDLAASTMAETGDFKFDSPKLIGNEALIHFLDYVAQSLKGEDVSVAKSQLDGILNGKEYFYIEWSFKTFNTWLLGKDFDTALMEDILTYTIEMDKF